MSSGKGLGFEFSRGVTGVFSACVSFKPAVRMNSGFWAVWTLHRKGGSLDPSTPFRVVGERKDGDTVIYTVVVPEESPFFEGHFPDRPVLPAIGQLAVLAGLVRRLIGSAASLIGVDSFKLSRQVLPGDQVEVRLRVPHACEDVPFEIQCNGASVSRGTARIATGSGK